MAHDVLGALAVEQDFAFTWAQALAAGYPTREAQALVRSGAWRRLAPGAYVDREVWSILGPLERQRCLVRGTLLRKGARWLAARRSAAILLTLPLLGDHPRQAQLLRDHEGGRAKSRSRHHRIARVSNEDRHLVGDIPVTGLGRTTVDLSREEAFRNGVIAADAALRLGLGHDELLAVARRCGGWPGGLRGLQVARFADGLAESALESLSRVACFELGLPIPELQIQVWYAGKMVARVDGLWRATNTVGQADGALKYKEKDAQAAAARVYADKKQDEVLEDLGLEVVRWGWTEAWRPRGVLDARLKRGFARGSRQTLAPGVTFVPTTLEQSLAWSQALAS